MQQLNIKIFGQVQGVGFRYSARSKAQELNLTGWVKNLSDNSVAMLAQGIKGDLELFLKWIENSPSFAKVERVEHAWQEVSNYFDSFEILI